MTPPQGLVSYPGVSQLLDASISLSPGISPSTATLTIVPQAELITEVGPLVFQYGGATIVFPDCKVERGAVERNSRGEIWRLSLIDRRWRWRYGAISGTYNARRDNFSLRQGGAAGINTERTPQQLAALCLDAMGETGYDVSALPVDARPSIEWDVDVPAEMLAALCEQFGCRVVLQLDNRVVIHRVGVGTELSPLGALSYSSVANPAERPDALAVVCGPNRYQVDFRLEAVGVESSDDPQRETLVALERLSYRPSKGWAQIDLPAMNQVADKFRGLAQRSVFRYYRIQSPITVPGYTGSPKGAEGGTVRLEQVLPIEDEQVAVSLENGLPANQPALVFGVWHAGKGGVENSAAKLAPAPDAPDQQGLSAIYRGAYTIDAARGLVIFAEPVYRNTHVSATGGSGHEVKCGPADLVLRAACSLRDAETSEPVRHVRYRQLGASGGSAVRYLKQDEIVLNHTPRYSDNYALEDVKTNLADVNTAADSRLDAAELEYEDQMPQSATYPGLAPIDLDGAIEHIEFQVGSSGATTTVARHGEGVRGWSQSLRRGFERQRAVEDLVRRTRTQELARAWKASSATRLRATSGAASPPALTKVPFKNVDSTAAPAFGVLEVTGAVVEDGITFLTCRRPGYVLATEYAINGPVQVEPDLRGACYRQGDLDAAYDTGSPVAGECWGPKADQWTLAKGYPPLLTVHAVRSSAGRVAYGSCRGLTCVVGLTDAQLPPLVENRPGQATVRVQYWDGVQFLSAQPTMTFTGYNLAKLAIAAGRLVEFTRVGALWIAVPPETVDQMLVKTNGAITANGGNGPVSRWSLNPEGAEESVYPPEVVTARNRTSVDIEAGVFCLAVRIDNRWYVEPWQCGGAGNQES